MPEAPGLSEWMRSDWNRRAREDAYYYVAFAYPYQSTEDFQSTAGLVVPMLEAELVRLPPGDAASRRALEVGCGPGRLMLPMSRHFAEIHGVDVSDEMIRIARELLRGAPNAHVHVNDGSGLPMFRDAYFDFAYSYAVFQHIPSKEVVLNYLREIRRVLAPDGVFRGQFHGLPQGEHPDTWGGCSFTGDEIAAFAASHGFQLLALSGEGTQYMLVTLRKRDRSKDVDVSKINLVAVTPADGVSGGIPQQGPRAGAALWLAGLPEDCDLNDLTVAFNGMAGRGCYLGPIGSGGGCQMNVLIPKGLHPGPARLTLDYRGKLLGEKRIEIVATARDPKVGVVTDAVNLLSKFRIVCGILKTVVQDVENPEDVSFSVDGRAATTLEFQCVDAFLDHYYYTVRLPPGASRGKCFMTVRVAGRELPPVELEIQMLGS